LLVGKSYLGWLVWNKELAYILVDMMLARPIGTDLRVRAKKCSADRTPWGDNAVVLGKGEEADFSSTVTAIESAAQQAKYRLNNG